MSESGASEYFIELNLAQTDGTLRYEYFGQNVLYQIDRLSVDGMKLVGAAPFSASATGEVRGSTVEFEYDWGVKEFHDGLKPYHCENLQDSELLKLPG